MPRHTHKRKASAHTKSKTAKNVRPSGLRTSNPKVGVFLGLFFVALGAYIQVFQSHGNAMSGIAILSIIVGVVTVIIARFSVPRKKTD